MGIFRILAIGILIYYVIKILSRIFKPFLLKYVLNKTGGGFERSKTHKQRKEGEVFIDKIPKRKPSNKNMGDYVDYEDID